MNAIRKSFVAGLATLAMTGALAASAGSAQAKPFFFPHHHHFGWGFGGLAGGLLLGAAAASAMTPTYDCGTVREAVVNRWGQVVGYRYAPAC